MHEMNTINQTILQVARKIISTGKLSWSTMREIVYTFHACVSLVQMIIFQNFSNHYDVSGLSILLDQILF